MGFTILTLKERKYLSHITNMNTPPAMTTTEPTTPVKEQPPKTYNGTPRKLDFSDCGPIPGKVIQPFDPVEWVYPNDGESEFYTYEQMMVQEISIATNDCLHRQ